MKQKILKGKIVEGSGEAAFFTQLDWVRSQCQEKLGFAPYPGTLNLELIKEDVPLLEELKRETSISLIPPDPNFCEAKTTKVKVGAIEGAIIIPHEDVNVHGKNIIEILAPVMIKSSLNVDNGDIISVEIEL